MLGAESFYFMRVSEFVLMNIRTKTKGLLRKSFGFGFGRFAPSPRGNLTSLAGKACLRELGFAEIHAALAAGERG